MPKGLVLNVDTTKSEFQNPMVELRQGDGNYQSLYVTVTDNGDPFDLTGWIISFMGTTAGSHKIVDASVTLDSNIVGAFTYTPTKAWGQDEGEFKNAYFKFVKNDETASGASFRVNVLNAVDLTDEEAHDYISVVDAMIDQVKTDMDSKLDDTKITLTNTQNQANIVQSNVNDLNNNVNQLKAQNNNLLTSDNTFTGNNTFTKAINGALATRQATFTDFNDVAKDMYKYSGELYVWGDSVKNSPLGANWLQISVVPSEQNSGYIRVADYSGYKIAFGTVTSSIITWHIFSDDNTVVHNTGNETISGDKTFTGNETFTNPINGFLKTRDATFRDFATVASDMQTYAGLWYVNGYHFDNSPVSDDLYGVVEVIPSFSGSTGIIRYSDIPNWRNGFYETTVDRNSINGWHKIADDASVVHNTGNETIAGDKTFTGSTTFSSVINGSINGNAVTATKATTSDSATTANDPNAVHLTSNQTISGNNTFIGLTDIQNQKQYNSSFTIGSNTINLTRVGSMVFVNAVTNADIAGGTSAGSIPAGFTPAGDTVFVGVSGTSISYMLFQSSKSVWIPSTIISTSRFGGTYLTNDQLPS